MFGAMVKTFLSEKEGIPAEKIVVVSTMPCTAKKRELGREYQNAAGVPDVDYSLTSREVARMIQMEGISFPGLDEEEFDAELTDVAMQEQREDARPAYAGEVPDLDQYTTVFIGSPVWWGDWPMIMYTFFEENADALVGKTLIPFSTHEGSGLSGFDRNLASSCPDSTVGKGIAIRGSDAQNDQDNVKNTINDWISELGL